MRAMRLQFGDCTFDPDARKVECSGNDVHLSAKAFQLLGILLDARPNPISKETLFEKLWPDTFVSEANLASLIKEIRSALRDDARDPRFIRTAHRFGYAFIAPATELPGPSRPIDSVAVLPFSNASGDPNLDYLSEGVSENLINALAALPGIRVTPRGTSSRYRGREGELSLLRRELNVRAIVTGRIRLHGGELDVQAEITDLTREAQLWGRQFRATREDIAHLQHELSREIAAALELRMSGDAERRLQRRYSTNSEAYQLYLRGRHHWNRRTLEGIERGIFYFQSAIDADRDYAPAYSGLADCYIALASRDLFPPGQLYPKAEAAAMRALAVDPELAEAHASIAAINEIFRWNWREAEREFLEAIRLNPSYVTARQWYGLALAHQRRFNEALRQLAVASESDPLSFMLNSNIATVQYLARDFAQAIDYCRRAIEINPHHEPSHFTLGLALEQSGERGEAATELEKALAISRGEPHVVAALGHLEAADDRAAAKGRLARLMELTTTRHVSPLHFATIHLALGDVDEAFECLRRAVELRSGWLVHLATEPRFDPHRDDERFAAIVREVGLAT